jgi:hypothetical protein
MNAFYEHHQDSIRFGYRCFDRLLLNGLIQPFQQPERVVGFFRTYRHQYPVTRPLLTGIADEYRTWIEREAKRRWRVPVLDDPKERRDEHVEQYFRQAKADEIVAIIRAREPARILIAIGKGDNWHLEYAQRWVIHYNIYVNDPRWGKMFVRMCPHFPFSARIYLNQHHWLANRMRKEGIDFRQCTNAFLECDDPGRLQELADSLTARDISTCAYKWLTAFRPFFTDQEWHHANCVHRLFLSQVEYCDNLIFHPRAALDALQERLLDANRTIGRPDNLSIIFGRRITSHHRGKLETTIQDMHIQNPLIRSYYAHGGLKQYVRDHLDLRTESYTNDVHDYGLNKGIENLPQLRQKLNGVVDSYLNVQQDILETFVDRGQLRQLTSPTVLPTGKRIPGLKLDHPRQLALMHALVRFAHIAAGDTFTAADLLPEVRATLGVEPDAYTPGSLRYDLSKLRAKGLVQKVPHSRSYRLAPNGYAICLVFLKIFERIYAPLAAGLLRSFTDDACLPPTRRHSLDRLYQRVVDDLDRLMHAVGLKIAA